MVRPVVKSFVEGENGCILLFGPTEGGKTYTMKGKTGLERGILPRAVEDMFNIVKNSEEREEDYDLVSKDLNISESDFDERNDFYNAGRMTATNATNPRDETRFNEVPERMFLKVSIY